MTARDDGDTDTHDGEILADLFDSFLRAILDGREPDLEQCQRERPELHDRIQKTWGLACSVAGRREPSRPVLGGYEILRELGHGGMGTVYLATHQALGRTGRLIYQLRGDRPGGGFGLSLCWLPWYDKPGVSALAVGARRGGPIGNGYVRVFDTARGQPLQTTAGQNMLAFAYSLVDLGDLDGDGFRDLGVSTLSPNGYSLWIVHYGQTPPEQRRR